MTPEPTPMIVLVGSFTSPERRGRAQGLRSYRVDGHDWHLLDELPAFNPSYLARHPVRHDLVYTCHSDGREVSAVRVGAAGDLHLAGRYPTSGLNGAHVAVAPDGGLLAVANFSSGNITTFALGSDGLPVSEGETHALTGRHGPRPMQDSCQPHQVRFSPDGAFLCVPDRGCDVVHLFAVDRARQRVRALPGAATAPGTGPRHLEWHPRLPVAYVLNELDNSIAACRWDPAAGQLTPGPSISALPPGIDIPCISAAVCVSPDGRFVYATTRCHNGICIYEAGSDGLSPGPVGYVGDIGDFPRFMEMEPGGDRLWIASHRSDDITALRIDRASGRLTHEQRLQSPSAACLLFMHRPGES